MKMKLIFAFLTLAFLVGCSGDDDDTGFPRTTDIEVLINSSDNRRLTEIETVVFGTGLELRTHSYSESHLPYKKSHLNQEIPALSSVNVSIRDNSAVAIGAEYEPYTVELIIMIDKEVAISEQHTIVEPGYVASIDLFLTDYFTNK